MTKYFNWLCFLLLLGMQGVFSTAGVSAEPGRTLVVGGGDARSERVAVVIGNSRYPSGALANPKNDATAIAASLKKLGFDVELKLDASKAEMDAIFKRFSAKADKATVAALFYAGHGIQVNGANYIVPIDAKPQTERDLKREMLRMDDVIDDMGAARVKLVFFDACRDNPLSRTFSRGGSRGMAAPVEASGTLISFATKHGNTAADGSTQHSPYTNALLAALEAPAGVEIEQMLRKVQQSVRQATNGQQEPWRYGSLDGEFYFQAAAQVDNARIQQEVVDRAIQEALKRAGAQAASEGSLRSAEQQAREREASALAVELAFWDSIKNSTSADDLREYLASYPKGRFAGLARNRIRSMEAAGTPAPAKAVDQSVASRPPEPAPIPMQLAMTAPPKATAAAASSAASAYPQAGDSWTYRYVDGWKKDSPQNIVVKVEESEGGRVTDRMSVSGGRGADERTHEGRVEIAERALGRDVRVIEMLPYVQGLLQDGLKPGQERSFPDTVIGAQTFRVKARLIGQEKITVPAGTFDAVRLEVVGQNTGGPVPGNRAPVLDTFSHVLWFVPEIRRVVKVAHQSTNSVRSRVDDDTLELVSFAIAGQAVQGAGAQLAAIAPPKTTAAAVGTLAYPKAGDSWTYRYVDAWKKDSPQNIVVKVEESEGGRVTDRMLMSGGRGADERTHEGRVEVAERALGRDVRVMEMLPYVQGLLQDGLKPGQERTVPDTVIGAQTFRVKARLIGQEKITVPAGTFDAVRLEVVGQNTGGPVQGNRAPVLDTFSHVLWFVPEIRRVVKVAHRSTNSVRSRVDDDTLELVSYSLR